MRNEIVINMIFLLNFILTYVTKCDEMLFSWNFIKYHKCEHHVNTFLKYTLIGYTLRSIGLFAILIVGHDKDNKSSILKASLSSQINFLKALNFTSLASISVIHSPLFVYKNS